MVTTVCSLDFGLSSNAKASTPLMCLCSRKVPGSRPAGLLLFFAALMNALVLATTPSLTRRGASEMAVSPGMTCTVTEPVPAPE